MKKDREWVSFSETDSNGVFREAYGYFKKCTDSSTIRERATQMRTRLSTAASVSGCASDAHDFEVSEVITGGMRYRCKKCNLEVMDDALFGSVEKRYWSSFINDVSYQWHPDCMDAAEITNLTVLYGESPRVKVTFDGESLMVANQSVNKSFGWNGFFNSRQVVLSDNAIKTLQAVLRQTDFTQWETPPSVFDKLLNPGFRIGRAFFCTFSNGRQYKCLAPQLVGFYKLTRLIEDICGIDRPAFPFPNMKTVTGKQTLCCAIGIPADYRFCPKCGKPVDEELPAVEIPYDTGATCWLCDTCSEGISMVYRYCGKCGQKRSW